MKTALLVRNGELADYPADLLIEGKVYKSYNVEFECEMKKINLIIGRSMPSMLIKKLRDKNVMFLKIKSLDEVKNLDFNINFPKPYSKKRGWGCAKTGFVENRLHKS